MYDNNGDPFGFICNGTEYYYIKNAQNDVTAIASADGTILANYYYDSWGKLIETTGNATIAELNPIRYRSYYYDSETEWYYLNTRYYSPELCRFISSDAFDYIDNSTFLGFNAYIYCANNPIMFVDYNGHSFGSLVTTFFVYGLLFASGALLIYFLVALVVSALTNTTFSFSLPSFSSSNTSAASKADAAIRSAISNNKYTKYWEAKRTNGYVVLGRPLTFRDAMQRVKGGSDVFASSHANALTLAYSITSSPIGPEIDQGKLFSAGYYYHYHINRQKKAHIFFLFY